MANRKRLGVHAPPGRWLLLGDLLQEWRRVRLGHVFRTTFARERLPLTADGNANTRRVDDLESNRRPNRWPEPTLKEMAAAYGVTYASMRAVLDGEADKLEPAAPVPAPGLPPAPAPSLLREDDARPYAAVLWNRLMRLAARGVPDPDGRHPRDWDPDDWDSWNPSAEQLGLSGQDADTWNGSRGAMSLADRAWLTGDWHARRAARNPARDTGATSA